MRAFLRWLCVSCLLALAIPIGAGVVGEFFIELARERGYYTNPSQRLDAAVTAFSGAVTSPWFLGTTAAVAFLTLGLWADWLLRLWSDPTRTKYPGEITPAALLEVRKLKVRIEMGTSRLSQIAIHLLYELPGLQKQRTTDWFQFIQYLYLEHNKTLLEGLDYAVFIERKHIPKVEVLFWLCKYLEDYKTKQEHIERLIETWGSNSKIDEAIQQWLPVDREMMSMFMEIATIHLPDNRFRAKTVGLGFAEVRFRKLVGKHKALAANRD